jgi:Raf kinase inhibitor-like YbhB/YbcL family protein
MRSRPSFRSTARRSSVRACVWLQLAACSSAGHAANGGSMSQTAAPNAVTAGTLSARGDSDAAPTQTSGGTGSGVEARDSGAGVGGSSAEAGTQGARHPMGSSGTAAAGSGTAADGGVASAADSGSTSDASGAGASAAGSGGSASAGQAGTGGAPAADGFRLAPVGVTMLNAQEFAFPASALPPANRSPEFDWSGVPAGTKSLALVFRDLSAGAVKWVLWDIPPTLTHVPGGIGNQASPSEVPGSSQLGSLGNQGYAGPCCTSNQYEFVLWALDVDKLPGTARLSTAQIHDTLLTAHDLASTAPVLMRIMH